MGLYDTSSSSGICKGLPCWICIDKVPTKVQPGTPKARKVLPGKASILVPGCSRSSAVSFMIQLGLLSWAESNQDHAGITEEYEGKGEHAGVFRGGAALASGLASAGAGLGASWAGGA